MSTHYRYLLVLIMLAYLMTACSTQTVQAGTPRQAAPKSDNYWQILGKSARDEEVANLITNNHCVGVLQFQLCREAGLALWLGSDGDVQEIYMYLHNENGFVPFKGELPFGLKFYDTMGAVVYKLNRQDIGNAGLPDETAVPDHIHYWALYQEAGITIIYNSPFADEDATIYAIVLNG